ncbi:MAG: hypothetical protein HUJ26_23765 [Planctomycetaceae bacterium]|nr:hypothetical protein [Planctomycetaceae bacterium]
MKRLSFSPILLFLATVSMLSGCGTSNFRWQTMIHEDGSMTRTISQPWNRTPDSASQFANWDRQGAHNQLTREYWPSPFTEDRWDRVKMNGSSEDRDYLMAEKTVDRIEDFPEHYRYELEGTNFKSVLRHQLTVTDYQLVKEYVWEEEITDIVEYEKIPQARRELIDLLADATQEAVQAGLGNEYNVSKLIEWMRTDGNRMLEEYTLYLYADKQNQFEDLSEEESARRIRDTFGKYGLVGFQEAEFLNFLRLRLKAGVRDRNGEPIDDEVVEEMLGIEKKYENNARHRRMIDVFKKRFDQNGTDAARLRELIATQFGIYHANILYTNDQFDIWIRLPGTIVQTNGTLETNGTARWSFDVDDISPTGYEMKAKALFPVSLENSNILPAGQLKTPHEMLTFIDLMQSDAQLQKTFEDALQENSLAPIIQLRDQAYKDATRNQNGAAEVKPSESRVRWWRCKQLLKLLQSEPDEK